VTVIDDIIEYFPNLEATGVCRAAFVRRIPGIDVTSDKAETLLRLEAAHQAARKSLRVADWPLVAGHQVHGNDIKIVETTPNGDCYLNGFDGFVTARRQVALGIHVADCCAVYIVDPTTPAVGLVHSGKRGTALGVAVGAIEAMQRSFGSDPAALVVELSPCIRPPHYEIDFAAEIREQCRAAGVKQIHDGGVCTACDLNAYYSYRAEKGKTGRMLALLGLL